MSALHAHSVKNAVKALVVVSAARVSAEIVVKASVAKEALNQEETDAAILDKSAAKVDKEKNVVALY